MCPDGKKCKFSAKKCPVARIEAVLLIGRPIHMNKDIESSDKHHTV